MMFHCTCAVQRCTDSNISISTNISTLAVSAYQQITYGLSGIGIDIDYICILAKRFVVQPNIIL